MSKSKRSISTPILVLILSASVVGALAYYVKTTPAASHVFTASPPSSPHHNLPTSPGNAAGITSKGKSVFVPIVHGIDVSLSTSTVEVPASETPIDFLAAQSLRASGLDPSLVLSTELRDHVAILNFSDGILSGMGSFQESNFLRAIRRSLGQFSSVDKVWFNVDGKPVESLGGHFDTTDPISVLRPWDHSGDESQPPQPQP